MAYVKIFLFNHCQYVNHLTDYFDSRSYNFTLQNINVKHDKFCHCFTENNFGLLQVIELVELSDGTEQINRPSLLDETSTITSKKDK